MGLHIQRHSGGLGVRPRFDRPDSGLDVAGELRGQPRQAVELRGRPDVPLDLRLAAVGAAEQGGRQRLQLSAVFQLGHCVRERRSLVHERRGDLGEGGDQHARPHRETPGAAAAALEAAGPAVSSGLPGHGVCGQRRLAQLKKIRTLIFFFERLLKYRRTSLICFDFL